MQTDKTYSYRSSAGGVVIHDNKVLVITSESRKLTGFPKGTIEKDEPVEQAALREVEEETGYRARVVRHLGNKTYDFIDKNIDYRKTVYYFLMELLDKDEPKQNLQPGEDFEVKWLYFEEAFEQLTFNESKEILKKALSNE